MLTGVLGVWTYALAQFAALSTQPAELLAGAAVAVAALLAVAIAAHLAGGQLRPRDDSTHRGSTLRERARRRLVPRLLDPDAAGRPRPRAPGVRRVRFAPAA